MSKRFNFIRQIDAMDCGPTCLKMVAGYYGTYISLDRLKTGSGYSNKGISLQTLANVAESIGFRTFIGNVKLSDLVSKAPLPCIVHWQQNHFVVVHRATSRHVYVADPLVGKLRLTHAAFMEGWIPKGRHEGIALFLEVTPTLYAQQDAAPSKGLGHYFNYFIPFKKYFYQLLLAMLVGTIIQMILPFLAQAIVDVGINSQNIGFINLILIAQLALFAGRVMNEFLKSWLSLHLSLRAGIAIVSDFLAKAMQLPVGYFDSKTPGDFLQRINDNYRIQTFISTTVISVIFSVLTLGVYSFIMGYYNVTILLIFLAGSAVYVAWTLLFLKKRKEFDYKLFQRNSKNQTVLLQLFQGIRDIKMFHHERPKRWEWEKVQAESYHISVNQLKVSQLQQIGATAIDQIKNILISYLAATSVIHGQMTLGMMLAAQYILGQLNGPISQFIGLINSYQDARISMERVNEIHAGRNEYADAPANPLPIDTEKPVVFTNVSFGYDDSREPVIRNVSLTIPPGQTTLIVGASGSGKTTLLKLLLKFYEPRTGSIEVGRHPLRSIETKQWRSQCTVLMQESILFSDTIANNIALGEADIDWERLALVSGLTNIHTMIKSMPEGFNTMIGADGAGISQGQKQRVLLARALYKDAPYVLLDEPTNFLDADNERLIMNNLAGYLKGKTAIIITHNPGIIKFADHIVAIKNGELVNMTAERNKNLVNI